MFLCFYVFFSKFVRHCLSICLQLNKIWLKNLWMGTFVNAKKSSWILSVFLCFEVFFLNFHWFGCDFKQIGQQSFVAKIIRLAHSNKGYYWELVHSQIKKFCWDQYMSDHIASCKWLQMEYATIFVLKNINICHKTKTLIILPKNLFFNQNIGYCSMLLLSEREIALVSYPNKVKDLHIFFALIGCLGSLEPPTDWLDVCSLFKVASDWWGRPSSVFCGLLSFCAMHWQLEMNHIHFLIEID